MTCDPILAEIRAVREAYSEKFGGDVKAMLADIRKRQNASGREVVSRPAKRIVVPTEPVAALR
jgi:hypothetical protein